MLSFLTTLGMYTYLSLFYTIPSSLGYRSYNESDKAPAVTPFYKAKVWFKSKLEWDLLVPI